MPTMASRIALSFSALSLTAAAHLTCINPALAGKTFLDLPECDNFQAAGAISYCDVREGTGSQPEPGDLIVVDYTARELINNTVYDGSRGFAFTVGNGEIVPGWEGAILGTDQVPTIKAGGIRTVLIPAAQAYGQRGSGCSAVDGSRCRVPPNADVRITFQYKGLGY